MRCGAPLSGSALMSSMAPERGGSISSLSKWPSAANFSGVISNRLIDGETRVRQLVVQGIFACTCNQFRAALDADHIRAAGGDGQGEQFPMPQTGRPMRSPCFLDAAGRWRGLTSARLMATLTLGEFDRLERHDPGRKSGRLYAEFRRGFGPERGARFRGPLLFPTPVRTAARQRHAPLAAFVVCPGASRTEHQHGEVLATAISEFAGCGRRWENCTVSIAQWLQQFRHVRRLKGFRSWSCRRCSWSAFRRKRPARRLSYRPGAADSGARNDSSRLGRAARQDDLGFDPCRCGRGCLPATAACRTWATGRQMLHSSRAA